MKKIKVNHDACIGCGACASIDPEHFEIGDDNLSVAINNENLESTELNDAIESCPTCAIYIEGDNNNACCHECECGSECECDDDCTCGCDAHQEIE